MISVVTSISIRLFSGRAPSPDTFRLITCSLDLSKRRASSVAELAVTVRSARTVSVAVIVLLAGDSFATDSLLVAEAASVFTDCSSLDPVSPDATAGVSVAVFTTVFSATALFAEIASTDSTVELFASDATVALSADVSVGEVTT